MAAVRQIFLLKIFVYGNNKKADLSVYSLRAFLMNALIN